MTALSPTEAHRQVLDGSEIAFVDIREAGQFIEGHALFAIPLPYSVLEAEVLRLIPRRDVRVVLCDDGCGLAARAAARLRGLGYTRVAWVDGGLPGWRAAGLGVFQGVNVPSKVLGELAETVWHPQSLTADAVQALREAGAIGAFLDTRPAAEHRRFRVPGSVSLPNGELAHRIDAVAGARTGTVLLTCAGRTRGITGAIGLRLSGHDGPVAVLENGTQGWTLSGRDLERGAQAAPLPALSPAQRARSRARADAMAARFGLPFVSAAQARALATETDRSTAIFDLRSPDEAAAAPLPGARLVEGVQLVQATDQHVGVRHARLILCCDTGLRSVIAAFWLRQLGFDPVVLRLDDDPRPQHFPELGTAPIDVARIAATALGADDVLVDLRASARFLQGHAMGARWCIRPRIGALDGTPRARRLALIADDPAVAALFAHDARERGFDRVAMIEGGHAALVAAGHRVIADGTLDDADRIDFAFFVHDRHDGNREASRRYLAWETGLIAQLSPEERAAFRLEAP